MGKTVTFTLAFNEKEHKLLGEMSAREGRSRADIIRRALTLYQRYYLETQENGNKIAIIDPNGRVKELVII
ncbi:MAG: ribbon-helix-helix protein, CopG family [Patescibacteria group bacterium]